MTTPRKPPRRKADAALPTKREMKKIEKAESKGLIDGFNDSAKGHSSYWTTNNYLLAPKTQKVVQGFNERDRYLFNGIKTDPHSTRFVQRR